MSRFACSAALLVAVAAPLTAQQRPDTTQQDTTRQRRQRPTERISTDQNEQADARVDNIPVGDQAGFVVLPNTEWRLRFAGYAKTDVMYDTRPAGAKDLFVTSSIPTGPPVPGEENAFNMHVRQTRLSMELRRPSYLGGDLRAYFEGDLYGPNNTTSPNLRHAYIQAANVLVGRTFTTFMDVDALPDGVDFEGPNSTIFLLTAQVRYTWPLGERWSLALAAEQPVPEITMPAGATRATRFPDVVIRPRYVAPWGHFQLSAVVRDLGYLDAQPGENRTAGFGILAATQVRITRRDNIFAAGIYGQGYSRFIVDAGGLNLDAAPDANGELQAIPAYGWYASLQHLLGTKWRAVGTVSSLRLEPVSTLPATTLRRTFYTAVSAVHSPRRTVDIGFSVLYGENHTLGGANGYAWRIHSALQLYLVK